MSRPVAEQDDYSISPSTDVHSLIRSERALFSSVFYDGNDSFHSELGEDTKTNAEKLAVCHRSCEETAVCPLMEANIAEHVDATNYFDGHNLNDIDLTHVPAPPISHSNPETPTEPLEMSFDTKPVEMTRNLSEQSPLAPRIARYANFELDGRPIHQGQNQVPGSAATNAPKSRARTPGPRSRVGSISGVSAPTARPQAGPEQTNRYEQATRFSNVRQHIGPSGLRNSIVAPPEHYDRPPSNASQMYPDPVQANVGVPSPSEQVQSHGNQYRHGFRSQSPQLWAQDQHASPYKTPMHLHNRSNSIGNFTSPDQYNTNSPHAIHSSPFGEDQLHANMTQGNVNLPRYPNELMLHQPPAYLPYGTQHLPQTQRRASNFDQNLFQTPNMKPENCPSGARPGPLKYQSLEDARREKSVSTLNSVMDHTVPLSAEDDRHYVAKMMASMLEMRRAEDNAGMKRTWTTMSQDADKVEKASWEILVNFIYLNLHSLVNATY